MNHHLGVKYSISRADFCLLLILCFLCVLLFFPPYLVAHISDYMQCVGKHVSIYPQDDFACYSDNYLSTNGEMIPQTYWY